MEFNQSILEKYTFKKKKRLCDNNTSIRRTNWLTNRFFYFSFSFVMTLKKDKWEQGKCVIITNESEIEINISFLMVHGTHRQSIHTHDYSIINEAIMQRWLFDNILPVHHLASVKCPSTHPSLLGCHFFKLFQTAIISWSVRQVPLTILLSSLLSLVHQSVCQWLDGWMDGWIDLIMRYNLLLWFY